jgi:UDP-N-acetyl-D-mannosaminuronic acid dehydrogenase
VSTVCVLGLGYVGLPTAAVLASRGHSVLGVDVNPALLARLDAGEVQGEEPGLVALVREVRASGHLRFAATPAPADVFVIAVPTPLQETGQGGHGGQGAHQNGHANGAWRQSDWTGDHPEIDAGGAGVPAPDLSMVIAAAGSILPVLRAGNAVVLESTSPPRTTTDVLRPILERGGLRVGHDLHVAYCPERVLPGRILEELVHTDRLVGGIDAESAEVVAALYRTFVQGEVIETDATTAELVKLMENAYRDVNVALANEFSVVSDALGVDVRAAIAMANRHPRVNILKPGPGVGGHCVAVDPWFLAHAAPQLTPLIQAARHVNDSMPEHVVARVREALAGTGGRVVACLGLAYKADVDDIRGSPSVTVARRLIEEGYEVRVCDPHVAATPEWLDQLHTLEDALRGADCAVLLADHAEFRGLKPADLAAMRRPVMLDTRGALDGAAWGQVLHTGGRHAVPV